LFSPAVQRAIVEEAHRAGRPVQTHTTSIEGVHLAVDAGVDLMQHFEITGPYEPMPPRTVGLLAEKRIAGSFVAQTLKALSWYREQTERGLFMKVLEMADQNERALIQGGATILLSTDGGVFSSDMVHSALWKSAQPPEEALVQLGAGHFNWLVAVEEKGMKPMDALLAATRNIARAYHVDKDLGTLEKGKISDILVLNSNPLDGAANYRSIHLIIKSGAVINREALPSKRLLTG